MKLMKLMKLIKLMTFIKSFITTSLRDRLVPLCTTVFVVVVGILLGQWQMRRATEKQAIEATLLARASTKPVLLGAAPIDVQEMEYRHVQVLGEFDQNWPIYLDNRPYKGLAGFYVLMPLKIQGSNKHVLVARGWVRRDQYDRTKLPFIPVPHGVIAVDGIAKRSLARSLSLGAAEKIHPHAIMQNVEIAAIAQASKFEMQTILIEQKNELPDGLVRDWPLPFAGVDKHRGYAFQWYALAAAGLLFFLVTGRQRARQ